MADVLTKLHVPTKVALASTVLIALAVGGVLVLRSHADDVNPSASLLWIAVFLAGVVAMLVGGGVWAASRRSVPPKRNQLRLGIALFTAGALITACMIGFIGLLVFFPNEDPTASELTHFSPRSQDEKARQVIDGLNTRDPSKAGLLRYFHAYPRTPQEQAADAAQERTFYATSPPAGCQYEVLNVQDRGEQGTKVVAGLVQPALIYQLDVAVEQHCPMQPSTSRNVSVLLVQSMGHWSPVAFAD